MVRVYIVGAILAAAFTLYAIVDAAMIDARRCRGVPKPVWVVLTVILPVIGGILWFVIGRGPLEAATQSAPRGPEDDPRFTGRTAASAEIDARIRDLEARLRELDNEVFPGEENTQKSATQADGATDAAPSRTEDKSSGSDIQTEDEKHD